jgi:Tripartite tricarboxylate transporter TctB family
LCHNRRNQKIQEGEMRLAIRHQRDFVSGLIFIAFGLAALVLARDYTMGSAVRMGPAYFPSVLGAVLALLGLIILLRALFLQGARIGQLALRPLSLILGGVLAFAFLLEPLGLIVATIALIVISALGGWEFRVRDVVMSCLVLLVLALGLFVYGLGMPLKVWPF